MSCLSPIGTKEIITCLLNFSRVNCKAWSKPALLMTFHKSISPEPITPDACYGELVACLLCAFEPCRRRDSSSRTAERCDAWSPLGSLVCELLFENTDGIGGVHRIKERYWSRRCISVSYFLWTCFLFVYLRMRWSGFWRCLFLSTASKSSLRQPAQVKPSILWNEERWMPSPVTAVYSSKYFCTGHAAGLLTFAGLLICISASCVGATCGGGQAELPLLPAVGSFMLCSGMPYFQFLLENNGYFPSTGYRSCINLG